MQQNPAQNFNEFTKEQNLINNQEYINNLLLAKLEMIEQKMSFILQSIQKIEQKFQSQSQHHTPPFRSATQLDSRHQSGTFAFNFNPILENMTPRFSFQTASNTQQTFFPRSVPFFQNISTPVPATQNFESQGPKIEIYEE